MLRHRTPGAWVSRIALSVVVAQCLAACGTDATSPGGTTNGKAGIDIVAGANGSDTVDAALPLALRVVVRDAAGRVMSGTVVRFTSAPVRLSDGSTLPGVLVGAVNALSATGFLAETTSAQGVVSARIVAGRAAGAAAVVISVPQTGFQDTARYTIAPGLAAAVVLPVVDTTLQVGRTLTLGGHVEDRYGNRRTDAVTYDAPGTGLTSAGGQLTATAPARAAVVGRLAGGRIAPDTSWVSAVPVATIAAMRGSKLFTAALDGTGVTAIPHALEANDYGAEWHPNGQSLLALLGTFGSAASLYKVELGGATQPLLAPNLSNNGIYPIPGAIGAFAFAPDAQSVFLSGGNCNYNAILYRLPLANTTALERLSPPGVDECFTLVNAWPSLSPDGTQLAYENQTWNQSGYSLRVMTIATRAITQLIVGGQRPRWSPSGDLIAYWLDKQIRVVKSDGTGGRTVSPATHNYVAGVRWSSDGQWIIARFAPTQGNAGTITTLLNVNTGLEIPLVWTSGYNEVSLPAWKPVP